MKERLKDYKELSQQIYNKSKIKKICDYKKRSKVRIKWICPLYKEHIWEAQISNLSLIHI